MNLKPIFASMILLGITAPTFADSSNDAMNAQLNKMQVVINQNSAGNYGTAAPGADWMNRITVSGQMNVDGSYGNRSPNFLLPAQESGSVSNLALNNANLFVDAQVNQWTKAHLSLETSSNVSGVFNQNPLLNGADNLMPTGDIMVPTSLNNSRFFVDEAYVTISDFANWPPYLKVGKEYVPFGIYDRNPIVMMPTQLLSEVSNTAAQVGFISPMGLYGSVYGIDGMQTTSDVNNLKHNIRSGGADLGYQYSDQTKGVLLDAGWIQNIDNSNFFSGHFIAFGASYPQAAGGLALSANANYLAFDAKLRYVAALSNLSFTAVTDEVVNATLNKLKAYGVEAGYSFPVLNHNTRAAVGWQGTNNAAGIFAHNIYYANYNFNVSRDTSVGVEVYNARDYSPTPNGSIDMAGTGNNATVGVVQLGVNLS